VIVWAMVKCHPHATQYERRELPRWGSLRFWQFHLRNVLGKPFDVVGVVIIHVGLKIIIGQLLSNLVGPSLKAIYSFRSIQDMIRHNGLCFVVLNDPRDRSVLAALGNSSSRLFRCGHVVREPRN
jgi:hypothetical protein